jgi:hypothetical protein
MSEWNGRLIKDMDLQHIDNTLRMLEKAARRDCKKAGGSDWKVYVPTVYFDLKEERDNRDHNF